MRHKQYAWVTVLLIGLNVIVSLYICGTLVNVYLGIMADDIGVSRSSFAITTTLRYAVALVSNIFIVNLIEKIGLKRLILIGIGSSFVMILGFSAARALPVFYIAGAIGGLGNCFAGVVPMYTLVKHFFPDAQGTFLAVTSSTTGIFGMFFSPFLSRLVAFAGWRSGFRLLAIIVAAIFVIELCFLHVKQEKKIKEKAIKREKVKLNINVVFLIAASMLFSLGALSVYSNMSVVLQENGLPVVFSTGIAISIINIFNISGKFAVGRLCDKFKINLIIIVWYSLCVIACMYFVFCRSNSIVAALPGIVLTGCISGIYTLPAPLMAGQLFHDDDNCTRVVGYCTAATNLSSMFATYVFQGFYDLYGSYKPSLIYTTILSVICVIIVVTLFKRIDSRRECYI